MALFLAGTAIVFIGVLRHAIRAAWDSPVQQPAPEDAGLVDRALVYAPLAMLLVLGLWMPEFLRDAIHHAAEVIQGLPAKGGF